MTSSLPGEPNKSYSRKHTESPSGAVLVYITVPNERDGKRLAQALVERRLAACVNMVPQITSVYRWEGEVQVDHEGLLLAKTQAKLVPQLRDAVVEMHPYDVPAITVLPLQDVHPPYLAWIVEETSTTVPKAEG